jgi:hypothetical protein
MKPNRTARRAELFATICALTLAVGCGNGDAGPLDDGFGTSTPGTGSRERTGSVSFALTTTGGVEFDAFRYAITGPNFYKAGSIDVSTSNTVSALVEGIPVGNAYAITLTGKSTVPPETTCSGSASFAVSPGAITNVPVSIACHLGVAVPIPPLAPLVLGFALLAAGVAPALRRRRRSAES